MAGRIKKIFTYQPNFKIKVGLGETTKIFFMMALCRMFYSLKNHQFVIFQYLVTCRTVISQQKIIINNTGF